jgi:hypothetical protein
MRLRQPKYRLHKARNCAVVTIAGRDHYLGTYDSPTSWEAYHRLVAEHLSAQGQPEPQPGAPGWAVLFQQPAQLVLPSTWLRRARDVCRMARVLIRLNRREGNLLKMKSIA